MWHKTAIFACLKIILCKLKISIFEGKNVHVSQVFCGEKQAGQRGENAAQSQPALKERIICRAKSPGGGLL